jgi:hypothetical protein
LEVKEMEEKASRNKVFNAVAWGAFILLVGVGWLASSIYQVSTTIYIAIGAGAILIALNLARWRMHISISKFSLFIGLILLALSGPGIAGFEMPFIPTLIALIGLFIVAEALQKMTNRKPIETTNKT